MSEAELDRAHTTRAERGGSGLLWVGTLTGPIAWSIHLVVNYNLEEIACAPATRRVGEIWGIGVETLMLGINVVLASATALAGVIAYRCWRRARGMQGESDERAAWMGIAGVMVSVLFLIIIGMGLAPQFFLDVCERTP
jgi:hypothetical protein